jgi:hypothetical protein
MEPASPLALEQINIVVRDMQRSLAVSTMHPAFSNWNRAVALPAWRTLKAIADAGQRQRVFSTTEAFWRRRTKRDCPRGSVERVTDA